MIEQFEKFATTQIKERARCSVETGEICSPRFSKDVCVTCYTEKQNKTIKEKEGRPRAGEM